jgi:hypothetical protein
VEVFCAAQCRGPSLLISEMAAIAWVSKIYVWASTQQELIVAMRVVASSVSSSVSRLLHRKALRRACACVATHCVVLARGPHALCGTFAKRKTLAAKMENGMLVDLRGRDGRDRLLFTYQTTMLTLIILITTVSCSAPVRPEPSIGSFEREPPFSNPVTGAANPPLVQTREGQTKMQRAQTKSSASPKVATVHAPKATTQSASRPAAKKANTPPRIDAQKAQLFREFQEWQRRRIDLP